MDWCAKMLGLGEGFMLEKKKGGGVIMVCPRLVAYFRCFFGSRI